MVALWLVRGLVVGKLLLYQYYENVTLRHRKWIFYSQNKFKDFVFGLG